MLKAQGVGRVELVLILRMAFKHHQVLVIQNQVRTFVKTGKHGKRLVQLRREAVSLVIAVCCPFRQLNQPEDLARQRIAHPGNGSFCAAPDETMNDLCIDTHHQGQIIPAASDVFRCVGQGIRAAEFLEADEVGIFPLQVEKQFGPGFKSVIRAVINHGRHIACCFKDGGEVIALCSR